MLWGKLQAHCADDAQDVYGMLLETMGENHAGAQGKVRWSLRGTVHCCWYWGRFFGGYLAQMMEVRCSRDNVGVLRTLPGCDWFWDVVKILWTLGNVVSDIGANCWGSLWYTGKKILGCWDNAGEYCEEVGTLWEYCWGRQRDVMGCC